MADDRNAFQKGFDEVIPYADPGDALGQQREKKAQEELQKRYEEMRKSYQQYRPQIAQAGTNALQTQLGAFGPMNDLLKNMYGPGAGYDLAALGQNPLQGMFDQRSSADKLFGQFKNGFGEESANNLLGTGDPNAAAGTSNGYAAGLSAAGQPAPLDTRGNDEDGFSLEKLATAAFLSPSYAFQSDIANPFQSGGNPEPAKPSYQSAPPKPAAPTAPATRAGGTSNPYRDAEARRRAGR